MPTFAPYLQRVNFLSRAPLLGWLLCPIFGQLDCLVRWKISPPFNDFTDAARAGLGTVTKFVHSRQRTSETMPTCRLMHTTQLNLVGSSCDTLQRTIGACSARKQHLSPSQSVGCADTRTRSVTHVPAIRTRSQPLMTLAPETEKRRPQERGIFCRT